MSRPFCAVVFSIIAFASASSPGTSHMCPEDGVLIPWLSDPLNSDGSAYLGTGYDPYVEKVHASSSTPGKDRGLKLHQQVLQGTRTPGCCLAEAVCNKITPPSRINLTTNTSSTGSVMTMNVTTAEVFGIASYPSSLRRLLTRDFVEAACALPKTYTGMGVGETGHLYINFFDTWGTEVLVGFEMAALRMDQLTANTTVLSMDFAEHSSANLSDFMKRAEETANFDTDSLDGFRLSSIMNKTNIFPFGPAFPVTPAVFPNRPSVTFRTKPISAFFRTDYLESSARTLSVDCPLLNETTPGAEPLAVLRNLENATEAYGKFVSTKAMLEKKQPIVSSPLPSNTHHNGTGTQLSQITNQARALSPPGNAGEPRSNSAMRNVVHSWYLFVGMTFLLVMASFC